MNNYKNHFTFIANIARMVLCIIILSACWTTATMANVVFQDEILYIDGIPTFLLSADYPYYRDHRDDWSRQLDMIKSMGVKIITFYMPWRHHAPNDPLYGSGFYDFTGQSQPNRDVKYFLDLIQQKELMAIVKPGPFIHAEVDYGGIPDYISQAIESGLIEAEKDCSDLPTQWQQPLLIKLPAALDPYYLTYVQDWLNHVDNFLVANNYLYPAGPVIGVQLLNEGIYSNSRERITGFRSYDWSLSSRNNFRDFLKTRYNNSLANYNSFHGTSFSSWDEIEPPRHWNWPDSKQKALEYLDWGEYCADFYRRVLATYKSYMPNLSVPLIQNFMPVYGYHKDIVDLNGVEHFNTRTVPDLFSPATHGYTAWVGSPTNDENAYAKLVFTAAHHRGLNTEGNWSYTSVWPEYQYTTPSYFESMLYTAYGATGLNIYIAASVDYWTSALDSRNTPPHGPAAPISENGQPRNKFWTVQQLSLFFGNEGRHLLLANHRQNRVAWGIYPPYSSACAWKDNTSAWQSAGFYDIPRNGFYGADGYQEMCKMTDFEFNQVNIKTAPLSELQQYKMICLSTYDWMDRATQDKLVSYVYNGGVLVLCDLVPYLDENMQPYTSLKDTIFYCPDVEESLSSIFTSTVKFNNGEFIGAALWRTRSITLTGNAVLLATLNDWGWNHNVAYRVPYGAGQGIFIGFHPWVNPLRNDGNLINKNKGMIDYLASHYAAASKLAWDDDNDYNVDVQELLNTSEGIVYVAVLANKTTANNNYKIWYTKPDNTTGYFNLALTAKSAALIGIENDNIRSALIRGVNDIDAVYMAPKVTLGSRYLGAAIPCDIMLAKSSSSKYILTVTNVQSANQSTTVWLPFSDATDITQINQDGSTQSVPFTDLGTQIQFIAYDTQTGIVRYEINI